MALLSALIVVANLGCLGWMHERDPGRGLGGIARLLGALALTVANGFGFAYIADGITPVVPWLVLQVASLAVTLLLVRHALEIRRRIGRNDDSE